jgi:uncharacterized protein (TIGR02284 family)
MDTQTQKIVKILNELIELDYDAIEAYEATIARLESMPHKLRMKEFCMDHERHTAELAQAVAGLGGTPSKGPDVKRFLTKGKVVIADMVGGDHTILGAMRLNEEVTNKAYEAALKAEGLQPAIRTLLERNLSDERRHREWLNQTLSAPERAPT